VEIIITATPKYSLTFFILRPPSSNRTKMRPLSSISTPLAVLSILNAVTAFYLPGVAPTNYHENDVVPMHVNTISPSLAQNDQQLRSVISYDCIPPSSLLPSLLLSILTSRLRPPFPFLSTPRWSQKTIRITRLNPLWRQNLLLPPFSAYARKQQL